ncbi:phage portal protein [Clostridium niameyense]|uniref:Phage portal protein n=1 Tax=Clostridium niameyense TaxID=1622073 RepID=A0A6M0RBX1_9CLOT|nr:phage portal protein [Clostridium niameyense]NEZ47801.1 phage portal protein [Clostridium niameyense]
MKISNLFELKANSKKDKPIYSSMMAVMGNTPKYTEVDYNAIAKEGYKGNWVIFRCMQEIIKSCIQLNWRVMRYNSKGEPEEIKNHPVLDVIKKPNPLYGQSELIKRAVAFYYIEGSAPFHKVVTTFKGVRNLYVYRPDKIKFDNTDDMNKPYKNIKYIGPTITDIQPENFMFWKNFNPLDEYDGLGRGMSVLEPILKNGDLLNSMVDWNTALLQNGGSLSGVISTTEVLGDTEFERAQETIKNKHQGKDSVGKFLLLDGGAVFSPTSINPKDMDWESGKNSTILDICIGMGIDPMLIGINEHSSYNNKNEAEKGLYLKTAIPLMQELADQLSIFLELQEGEYLDIDYSHIPCLQEDMKEMAEILNKSNDMTINEKRAKRGLEPVEGGDIIAPSGGFAIKDGKVYLPMGLVDIEEENHNSSTQNINNEDDEKENKSFMY